MDVMVPPHFQMELREILEENDVTFSVLIEDVQQVIREQMESSVSVNDIFDSFDYNVYHTYEEVKNSIQFRLASYSE